MQLSTRFHSYDPQECLSCDGGGVVSHTQAARMIDDESIRSSICEECSGTGRRWPDRYYRIGGVLFDARLIYLLSQLFRCEIGVLPDTGPSRFRFWDGDGLIMPAVRRDGYEYKVEEL